MRRLTAGLATAAALAAAPAEAATLELRELAARVTVIPEDRADIKVEFVSRHPNLPITLRQAGDRVVLDGGLARRIRGCRSGPDGPGVVVAGYGVFFWPALPQIVVRTPRAVDISAGGAVFGVIGRAARLSLATAGCGDWTAGDVDGPLRLTLAGSGDARVGASRSARLRVAGSGDIQAGPVHGPVDVELGGSGDIRAAGVDGALKAQVAGSGDVEVLSGRATSMEVAIAGSGDVDFGGVATALKVRITGSGEVRARRVTGPVAQRIIGSGRVRIGDR